MLGEALVLGQQRGVWKGNAQRRREGSIGNMVSLEKIISVVVVSD